LIGSVTFAKSFDALQHLAKMLHDRVGVVSRTRDLVAVLVGDHQLDTHPAERQRDRVVGSLATAD